MSNKLKNLAIGCFSDAAATAPNTDPLLWTMDNTHFHGNFSCAAVKAHEIVQDYTQLETAITFTFFGVYDGHNGHEASRIIVKEMFLAFTKYMRQLTMLYPGLLLKKSIADCEKVFRKFVDTTKKINPLIKAVGSSCLVGLLFVNTLYTANLGDSRAVLGHIEHSSATPQQLLPEDSVNVPEVREKLKKRFPDDKNIVVNTDGTWRVKGITEVTKSIGDFYLKNPKYALDPKDPKQAKFCLPNSVKLPLLSQIPKVCKRKLEPEKDRFVILASHGFWEHLSNQEACDIVYANLSKQKGIAEKLLRRALKVAARKSNMTYDDLKNIQLPKRREIHDDMSVIVIFIDPNMPKIDQGVPGLSIKSFSKRTIPFVVRKADVKSKGKEASTLGKSADGASTSKSENIDGAKASKSVDDSSTRKPRSHYSDTPSSIASTSKNFDASGISKTKSQDPHTLIGTASTSTKAESPRKSNFKSHNPSAQPKIPSTSRSDYPARSEEEIIHEIRRKYNGPPTPSQRVVFPSILLTGYRRATDPPKTKRPPSQVTKWRSNAPPILTGETKIGEARRIIESRTFHSDKPSITPPIIKSTKKSRSGDPCASSSTPKTTKSGDSYAPSMASNAWSTSKSNDSNTPSGNPDTCRSSDTTPSNTSNTSKPRDPNAQSTSKPRDPNVASPSVPNTSKARNPNASSTSEPTDPSTKKPSIANANAPSSAPNTSMPCDPNAPPTTKPRDPNATSNVPNTSKPRDPNAASTSRPCGTNPPPSARNTSKPPYRNVSSSTTGTSKPHDPKVSLRTANTSSPRDPDAPSNITSTRKRDQSAPSRPSSVTWFKSRVLNGSTSTRSKRNSDPRERRTVGPSRFKPPNTYPSSNTTSTVKVTTAPSAKSKPTCRRRNKSTPPGFTRRRKWYGVPKRPSSL